MTQGYKSKGMAIHDYEVSGVYVRKCSYLGAMDGMAYIGGMPTKSQWAL